MNYFVYINCIQRSGICCLIFHVSVYIIIFNIITCILHGLLCNGLYNNSDITNNFVVIIYLYLYLPYLEVIGLGMFMSDVNFLTPLSPDPKHALYTLVSCSHQSSVWKGSVRYKTMNYIDNRSQ